MNGISRVVAYVLLAFLAVKNGAAQGSGHAQRQRDAAYQSTFQSYVKDLKPEMIRSEVEDYLRSKNVQFQQTCCFEGRRTPDDLVKIGQEPGPWFCSRTNVYVAFEFDGEERHPVSKALHSDRLQRVSLLRWPEDCL